MQNAVEVSFQIFLLCCKNNIFAVSIIKTKYEISGFKIWNCLKNTVHKLQIFVNF